MDKKNAIRSESVLNQNIVKVYTDGSKLNGRVGADMQKQFPKTSIFSPWNIQYCVPGLSLSYFRRTIFQKWQRTCFWKKMHNHSIVELVDSQVAIKSRIKCTVTSITVFNCCKPKSVG